MAKKILIVDDSPTERHLLVQMVKEEGYDAIEASSGEEGVAKARQEKPALVLMDVVMPGLNGYQATREIAKNKETENIPVIICTSRGAATDKLWGLRQGALEYMVKPIQKKELIEKIKKIFGGQE